METIPRNYILRKIHHSLRKGDVDEARRACAECSKTYGYDPYFARLMRIVEENLGEDEMSLEESERMLSALLGSDASKPPHSPGMWLRIDRPMDV